MTSMPDLPTAGRGLPLPVLGASGRRDGTTVAEPRTTQVASAPLEPIGDSAASRAETRRLLADRVALETQTRTAEGLKDVLAETSRQVQPQVADMRKLYEQPRPSDEAASRAQDDAKLAATEQAAQRTRVAAAKLAALRITNQEKAARVAEDVRADAQRLADLNKELTAEQPPSTERRTEIQRRQRQIADGLAEKVGASIRENADGTVDATLDDRALVRGDRVEEDLAVSRPVSSSNDRARPADGDPGPEPTPAPDRPPVDDRRDLPRDLPPARPDADVEGRSTRTPDSRSPREVETSDRGMTSDDASRRPAAGSSPPSRPEERPASDAAASRPDGAAPGGASRPSDPAAPARPGPPADGSAPTPAPGTAPSPQTTSEDAPGLPGAPSSPPPVAGETTGAPSPGTTDPRIGGATGTAPAAPTTPPIPPIPTGSSPADAPTPGAAVAPTTPGPVPGAPAVVPAPVGAAAATDLQVQWADGSAATVGGRLGAHVAADRTLLRPAVEALDDVARSLVGAVADAQAGGTTAAGTPGVPLLTGDSAWTLRVADGVTASDVAAGAPIVGDPLAGSAGGAAVPTTPGTGVTPGTPAAPGALPADGVTDPATSDSPLEAIQAQAAATAAVLRRRAGLVGAFDAAATASARLGQHVSEALGAIGEVSSSTLVPALHQANAAMASAGSAARQAIASGVPVLVGSSDPTVATAAGVVPLTGTGEQGNISEILSVDVRSVAGAPGAAGTGAVPGLPGAADATAVPGATGGVAGATGETAARTVATISGAEFTSSSAVLTGVRPGLDVTVAGPGTATLAVTPDPGPALGRVQALVDAVGTVASAVGGALPGATSTVAQTPSAPKGGFASAWSAMTSAASSFTSSFAAPAAAPAAGDSVAGVLGAVAAPLASAVGEAFVDADGRPLIAGTSVHRGRVALDREAFAREYVKDAVGVENAIASVARSVASTSDAASDPRVGALAIRIQAELAPQGEYTIDKSGAEQKLDARRIELDRRVGALQSLLEHLEDQSGWLASQRP